VNSRRRDLTAAPLFTANGPTFGAKAIVCPLKRGSAATLATMGAGEGDLALVVGGPTSEDAKHLGLEEGGESTCSVLNPSGGRESLSNLSPRLCKYYSPP
jgi:hypothetical protein